MSIRELRKRESAQRQAERSRLTGFSLTDPLPKDVRAQIDANVTQRSLNTIFVMLCLFLLFCIPHRPQLNLKFSLIAMPSLIGLWLASRHAYGIEERARRFIAGRDPQYWFKNSMIRGEDDPVEEWYEVGDQAKAQHDSVTGYRAIVYLLVLMTAVFLSMMLTTCATRG